MQMMVPESKNDQDLQTGVYAIWPPKKPNCTAKTLMKQMEDPCKPFAVGGGGQIYKMKGEFAGTCFKSRGTQREYELMKEAGACAVKVYGREMNRCPVNRMISMGGFLMKLEKPLIIKSIVSSQRQALMQEMISIVHELHQKRIVHGDIKPTNMLICGDGKLRLCDFAEGRRVDDDPATWEGDTTWAYTSPPRWQKLEKNWAIAPTKNDDLYSLGLSIWELYTQKVPFYDDEEDPEVQLMAGKTVNVDDVAELDVREIVRKYLEYGFIED